MSTECALDCITRDIATQSIEVSGWDAEGNFFVEIADLYVSDSGEATARICHRLNTGSLVFVRSRNRQSEDTREQSYPSANEAHTIGMPDPFGRSPIRLTPCRPRATRRLGDQKVASRI
jgi:hypothetical protein